MNKLKIKDKAINFETTDYLDKSVNLQSFKGKKIFLSFFRDASCTFCNIRLNQLIKRHEEFANRNIQIISFFASSKEDILRYANGKNAPFPIVPDPKFEFYKLYGVENSLKAKLNTMIKPQRAIKAMTSKYFNPKSFFEENIVPADFMINEEQIIDKAYYGKDFGDHIPMNDVLEWKIN